MWLDRLAASQASASGPSTPQITSRHNSPLPRRTSSTLSPYITSQRQGPSPRGSSLSLVSSESTTSLLASSRKPNGSDARQQPGQAPDSVDVLEKLLAADSEVVGKAQSRASLITAEDLTFDVDFGGLSLKELAAGSFDQDATSLRRPQSASECASRHAHGCNMKSYRLYPLLTCQL